MQHYTNFAKIFFRYIVIDIVVIIVIMFIKKLDVEKVIYYITPNLFVFCACCNVVVVLVLVVVLILLLLSLVHINYTTCNT